MEKYTVIIKNNTTGEVLFEKEINTMIAGIASGNEASSIILKGTEDEVIIAINVVQNEIDRIFERCEDE